MKIPKELLEAFKVVRGDSPVAEVAASNINPISVEIAAERARLKMIEDVVTDINADTDLKKIIRERWGKRGSGMPRAFMGAAAHRSFGGYTGRPVILPARPVDSVHCAPPKALDEDYLKKLQPLVKEP